MWYVPTIPSNPADQAGLLGQFAQGRLHRPLVDLHKAGGQRPIALPRFVQAFDQQDFAVLFGQHTRGHFGIAEEDEAAVGAFAAHAPEEKFVDRVRARSRGSSSFPGVWS